jgi:hypothetical protein
MTILALLLQSLLKAGVYNKHDQILVDPRGGKLD